MATLRCTTRCKSSSATPVTFCLGGRVLESRSCQLPRTLPSALLSECHSDQLAGGILLQMLAQVCSHYAARTDSFAICCQWQSPPSSSPSPSPFPHAMGSFRITQPQESKEEAPFPRLVLGLQGFCGFRFRREGF